MNILRSTTHDLSVRAYLALTTLVTAFLSALTGRIPAGPLSPGLSARARALSFFEYAILGAIVILVGIIFQTQLKGLVTAMWGKITESWNTIKGG